MNIFIKKLFCVIAAAGLISGCSTSPDQLELNYGKAYRNMIAEQIYDPDAAMNPPVNPPENMDGERASGVIEKYRVDKNEPQAPAVSIKLGK